MSYNEEKMMILKMLEEGKISSDDAIKLLDAIESKGTNISTRRHIIDVSKEKLSQINFNDEVNNLKNKLSYWKNEFKNSAKEKIEFDNDSEKFDKTIEEFSHKIEKLGKNVKESSLDIADKISDFVGSFIESRNFEFFSNVKAKEKIFIFDNVTEETNLNVEAINGHILLQKHSDNNILIKTWIKSPYVEHNDAIKYDKSPNSVDLTVKKGFNVSVSHEIFLPDILINSIKLNTINGRISLLDISSKTILAFSKNAVIDLIGVKSEKIKLSTRNARIQMSYVFSNILDLETLNGSINIHHSKSQNMNLTSTNGRLVIDNVYNISTDEIMKIDLNTSNAPIKIRMSNFDDTGYIIKASTTSNQINVFIPELNYATQSEKEDLSLVEAKSLDFENKLIKVDIHASTTNGIIEIID